MNHLTYCICIRSNMQFCALDYADWITNYQSLTLGSKDLSFHLLNQLLSKKIKHVFFIFLFFLTSVVTCQTILHNICQFISIHMSIKHYAKNSRCKHKNRGCTKIHDEIRSDNIIEKYKFATNKRIILATYITYIIK